MEPEIVVQGGNEPLTSCVSMESFEQICHERDALETKNREWEDLLKRMAAPELYYSSSQINDTVRSIALQARAALQP